MILLRQKGEKVGLAAQENMRMYQLPSDFEQGVFRTYDIRGPVEAAGITENLAYAIGRAIAAESLEQGVKTVIVGRDGRNSGPELMRALQAGLMQAGCDVVCIGLVSSPMLYFATKHLPYRTGVMLTASHNPGHHNGFKTILNGTTLSTAGVQQLKERILQQDLPQAEKPGVLREESIVAAYEQAVCEKIKLNRPLKVVVDAGNGMAGPFAPAIYKALGCEVVSLYEQVDGNFPNHHPDPTIPENLVDLQAAVAEHKADLGLAFDGDADRVGVVSNSGQVIWPDRQMMLFAKSVLASHPGSHIVYDVKCSTQLAAVIAANGGTPVMSRTGHSLLKERMFVEKAPLAGEMSGHVFFNDKWFGFDDGIYVGARLLEIIASDSLTVDEQFAQLPCPSFTPELKLAMPEDRKEAFMQSLMDAPGLQDAKRITIDGLRVEWPDGWGLVRPSNTSAYLTIRFEGDSEAVLQRVKNCFQQALLEIDPVLKLPW
jgi:phosphomannomutase / phosphoglucomutase